MVPTTEQARIVLDGGFATSLLQSPAPVYNESTRQVKGGMWPATGLVECRPLPQPSSRSIVEKHSREVFVSFQIDGSKNKFDSRLELSLGQSHTPDPTPDRPTHTHTTLTHPRTHSQTVSLSVRVVCTVPFVVVIACVSAYVTGFDLLAFASRLAALALFSLAPPLPSPCSGSLERLSPLT